MGGQSTASFDQMLETLKKAAAALREANVPHVLAGSLAVWARGGPGSDHDLDFVLKPEDADRALQALADAGMRPEKPPEGWLYKAWDGEVLVDLIFSPSGVDVDDALIERGDEREVYAVTLRVMAPEDVMISKLLALREHELDYAALLEITRAIREQIDWAVVWRATEHSPFARGFFTVAEGLELIEPLEREPSASGTAQSAS